MARACQVVTHPFWKGDLQHLARELETTAEVQQTMRQSIASFRASLADLHKGNSVLGHVRGVELSDDQRQTLDKINRENLGTLDDTDNRPGKARLEIITNWLKIMEGLVE